MKKIGKFQVLSASALMAALMAFALVAPFAQTPPTNQGAARGELREAEQGGAFNEGLAAQKLSESATIQARLMGERFRMRQEMTAVLTPEQKTQLDQMRQESKTRREQFKSRRAERRARQG
jgi:Spy/CpxP family protein refolding chaperone